MVGYLQYDALKERCAELIRVQLSAAEERGERKQIIPHEESVLDGKGAGEALLCDLGIRRSLELR